MDIGQIGVLPHARPAAGWPSRALIVLAALLAIAFIAAFALPYLMFRPEAFARYLSRREWLLVHVASGAVALLVGPVQLWLGISRRAVHAHRWLGLTYVSSVGIGSVAAFYLATHTDLGWGFGTGI